MLVAACAVTSVGACTPADRSAEATALRDSISAMPGVDEIDMTYISDFTAGYSVSLDIVMPTASSGQIGAVASTLGEAQDGDLQEYKVSADIVVADKTMISMWRSFDPGWATSRAHLARALRPVTGPVSIHEHADGATTFGSVTVADPTATVADAVRIAGDIPVVGSLRPADPGVGPGWTLAAPTSDAVIAAATREVAGLSVEPTMVEVDGNGISGLTVQVPDIPDARTEIVALAAELRDAQPTALTLSWVLLNDDDSRPRDAWSGSARVGDCDYSKAVDRNDLTPVAAELQHGVRNAVGDCG